MLYSQAISLSTPSISSLLVPTPVIFAPIFIKKLHKSSISGSFAAFSKIVFPLALTAAIIIFSVAPTLGKSRTIFPPIKPFSVVASTYPCSIFIFAPNASKPFKCKSTGLAPIAQPPGRATFPLFSMASIPPITKNEALIFLTKS